MKCRRALSTGTLSDLCWLTVDEYDLSKAALMPEGGSNTKT
jgi:hypothetical protein